MQITGLRTSHSCFHHPSWDPTNFPPEFLKNRGTNHHFPKTAVTSSTNQVSNTPEENMQCHNEHVYHTPSIILKFQMENPLFTLYHIWWPLAGFDFLTTKKALVNRASTSSINRIVTYRSRKKHPWGRDIVMGHGAWWKWKSFWSEMFAWTVTLQAPKIQRTPYYAFLISARVHLNFGECGVKKQHSIQYCECPDRSCFVWSNKANVVYLVMLLVGQHIIAAEKILQKALQKHLRYSHVVFLSASRQRCSYKHHTSKKANLLSNSTYSPV